MKKFDLPILAIDYGTQSTGFAISLDGINPLFLDKKSTGQIKDILNIIEFYKPKTLLLGLPVNTNKKQSDKIKSLAGNLKQQTNLPIFFQDESFTTRIAENLFMNNYDSKIKTFNAINKRKNIITRFDRTQIKDETAAFIILEIFLQKTIQKNNSLD